ncbi:hypothetical protein niasHT_026890 [Heterodera trifolii]|uniref:Uncharacterized protein n=1 Tax=Heterodera trifolii TaxID=157864 RepID=A0ABD2JXU6_9BILA
MGEAQHDYTTDNGRTDGFLSLCSAAASRFISLSPGCPLPPPPPAHSSAAAASRSRLLPVLFPSFAPDFTASQSRRRAAHKAKNTKEEAEEAEEEEAMKCLARKMGGWEIFLGGEESGGAFTDR